MTEPQNDSHDTLAAFRDVDDKLWSPSFIGLLVTQFLGAMNDNMFRWLAVWIGKENPVDELQSFGMISSAFPLAGRQGTLAVLGLRRMPYDRAIHGVQALLRTLNRLS